MQRRNFYYAYYQKFIILRNVIMTDYVKGLDAYEKKDYKAAIDIFLLLANQDHADSQNQLGNIYNGHTYYEYHDKPSSYSEVMERMPSVALLKREYGDSESALKWYQRAAWNGHADAQYNLSRFYFMLEGFKSENKHSVYWCKESANQGHAVAQEQLAIFYKDGVPGLIEQDDLLAWKWYEKAAAHTINNSFKRQGYFWDWQACMSNFALLADEFIKSNDKGKKKLAIAGLVKHSDLGDADAKISLANFYIDDDDIENVNNALKLYNEVITSSESLSAISSAQWNLCLAYMYGTKHIEVDTETALNLAKKAANNDPSYYHNMAYFYRGGYPLEADYKKVISLYKKHSESSRWDKYKSDYELAKIYRDSKYSEPDYAESFNYCKKAAKGGGYSEIGKEAKYLLAEMYLNGEGVKQNLEKACRWYKEVIKHARVFWEEDFL